jgi:hypothetical protein
MNDALTEIGLGSRIHVTVIGEMKKTSRVNGYSSFWGGVHLQFDSTEVFFPGRTDHALPALSAELGKTVVVLAAGTPIAQTAVDTLKHSGADWIVCSYSEQQTKKSDLRSTSRSIAAESKVVPLVEIGWIRFSLNHAEPVD